MICLKKFITLALLCVLLVVTGSTQTIKGTVRDTAGKALPYVTISLKTRAGNTILAYVMTDTKGNFMLKIPGGAKTDSLVIEARTFGYRTEVKNMAGPDAAADFILSEAVNQLQEVVVKSERPVLRTRGDTLGYKVSEFASPQDRTIAEVIRKMPGITVAADGTISYNNKPVSSVYIDGDNLLDDKYSIATNTIPHGVVNQVQVIQNEQPIKVLQNKVMSEAVALNLEIKKGARLQMAGQETVGAGLPGKYDLDLNAMMFKARYKAVNYFKANNTGNDLQRELVSHNLSSYQQRIDNAVPATILSLGAITTPALELNRYLFNQAGVINLNNLVTIEKNVQMRINAYYLHDRQEQQYSQRTNIFLPGDTVTYNERQGNRLNTDILHSQFTLNINRPKYYLNDVLMIDHKNNTYYSGLQTDSVAVNQTFKDPAISFSNELNFIRALRSNHIIQASSYISYAAEPENRSIDPGYNAPIFNNSVPYARLVQRVDVPSWYTNNYFAFRIPSDLLTQSFRTGFSVQSQTLGSDLKIVQNNNSFNGIDSARNHLNWTKQKLYAEAAYDLPGTILKANLTLPLILQQINYSNDSYSLNKSLKRFYFNPQLNAKYQLNVKNYMNLAYSYRNQIGTIENVYPSFILTDYRTLTANNGELTERSNQQVVASFSHNNALTIFFWSIGAFYDHINANSIASNVITNNIQKGIVLAYPNSTDSWILKATISKYCFPLRSTLGGAVQWQSNRSVQMQNNAVLPFNTISAIFSASADTKVSDRINLSYKATLTQTNSHSSAETAGYGISQLLQQATLNYNPIDKIQFKVSGEHYFTHRQAEPDLKYFFADASLQFKIDKWKTDLEISAVNFLNVKTYNALYLSANTFSASSYTLPGRIGLLKLTFRI